MGNNFIDQYSLLHFAVGIVMCFWGMPFYIWFIIHIIFEIIENTNYGVYFIDNNLKNIWPGGKLKADTIVNNIGDQTFAMLGWLLAYYIKN